VDKAAKLETVFDRIELVKTLFGMSREQLKAQAFQRKIEWICWWKRKCTTSAGNSGGVRDGSVLWNSLAFPLRIKMLLTIFHVESSDKEYFLGSLEMDKYPFKWKWVPFF